MSYQNGQTNDLDVGDYDCWAASPVIKLKNVGGERKCIVSVCVQIPGEPAPRTVDTWLTLDPKIVTSNGKPRIEYTWESLRGLGATDPAGDIMVALEEDRGAQEITINGITGEGAKLGTLNVTAGQSRNFYNLYTRREPVGDDFLQALKRSAGSAAKKKATQVNENPFASPAPARAQVQPPPAPIARPAPTQKAEEVQLGDRFDFGANAPAVAAPENDAQEPAQAQEAPVMPPTVEPAGNGEGGGKKGKKGGKSAPNVTAE